MPRGARIVRARRCRHVTHRGLSARVVGHGYSSAAAGRFGRADQRARASERGERLDLGRERAVVAVRGTRVRTSACTASSGGAGAAGGGSRAPRTRRAARSRARASVFSTTRAALRAAVGPIETWSSLPAEVGIESTLAGWASILFSETSAAAVTWAIMKPEFRPPSRARKAGRPDSAGLTSRSMRRSLMRRELGRGDREQVGARAPPAGRGSCRPRGARRSRRRPSGCRWPRSSRSRGTRRT